MKKRQAVNFWTELQESTDKETILRRLHNKPGYPGERTLIRYSQLDEGLRQGVSVEELAGRTGWGESYLTKVCGWWREEFELKWEDSQLAGGSKRPSPHPLRHDLDSLLISTPVVTHKRGSPTLSLAQFSHCWIVKVRLENTSSRVITLGDFALEVSEGATSHVLPHLGSDVHGSRAQIPLLEETLDLFVTVTPDKPVLMGSLRFIDDSPFAAMPVDVSLLVKGTGQFKGAGHRHELGRYEKSY